MKCKGCGKELCTTDYGYYCDNSECPEYDKLILAYESEEA